MKKKYKMTYLDNFKETPVMSTIIELELIEDEPNWYSNHGYYKKGVDPEVTCWNCKNTLLCDAMDATCRICDAPFDENRCDEFGFKPQEESLEDKIATKECFHNFKNNEERIKFTVEIARKHYQQKAVEVFDKWEKDSGGKSYTHDYLRKALKEM